MSVAGLIFRTSYCGFPPPGQGPGNKEPPVAGSKKKYCYFVSCGTDK